MDMNDYTGSGMPYPGLLMGLDPLLAMDKGPTFQSFDDMTEAEKEQLIMRCKAAKTVEEKQKILSEAATDLDIRALADEVGVNGGISTNRHQE